MTIRLNTPKENHPRFIITKDRTISKSTNIYFKNNGDKGERKSKREKSRVETGEQPSEQRLIGTDLGRENLKVVVF